MDLKLVNSINWGLNFPTGSKLDKNVICTNIEAPPTHTHIYIYIYMNGNSVSTILLNIYESWVMHGKFYRQIIW